ncbi:SufE family protein [Sulfidibacter corallicola]|uniref:SufE family protein n=1 Tax=Sulfidibacter corallicola TaxID=2818388 RepID=A0A8A4TRZ0_SULCO|nr:SufE family protein [Sulfidibacter corallicola]QTD52739.1 SufE family protein [Sulfidibacter corallicola]
MAIGELTVDELIENFELFDDWEDRYRYLIDLGRKLPDFPESEKNDINKVEGCISQVWMITRMRGESPSVVDICADSDAHIVKGLIGVLLTLFSGKEPGFILQTDINDLFDRLELGSHLSVNRRNGFYSMVERIKAFAAANAA